VLWSLLLLAALVTGPGGIALAGGDSVITPGIGAGRIKLGESKDSVLHTLGKADNVNDSGEGYVVYEYYRPWMQVVVHDGRVQVILVRDKAFRTTRGIGVGTPMAEAEASLAPGYERRDGQAGPELISSEGIRFLFGKGDKVICIEVRAPSR